jgi:hypothetical protein
MYLQRTGISILALQETWRDRNGWPIRIKGYQVLEAVADRGVESRNGLALLIKSNLTMYEVGEVSPYLISTRVRIGIDEWSIINVYIPCAGMQRGLAISHIRSAVQREMGRDLSVKLIIMGDWNMDWAKVCRLLGRWRVPLSVVPCAGNPATFRGPRRWTAIDHIVASREALGFMKSVYVNRNWDLSDHWPLQSVMRGLRVGGEIPNPEVQAGLRIDISKLGINREAIIDDNRWSLLGQLLEEEDENRGDDRDLAVVFQETVGEIARDLEIIKPLPLEIVKSLIGYRNGRKVQSLDVDEPTVSGWFRMRLICSPILGMSTFGTRRLRRTKYGSLQRHLGLNL